MAVTVRPVVIVSRIAREAVVAAVRARYAEPLAEARMFRRIMLLFRMRREIAQEVAKLAPPGALYVARD